MEKDNEVTVSDLMKERREEDFRGINWGLGNLTYNEILTNLDILKSSLLDANQPNHSRSLLIQDMLSKNNPYSSFIVSWMGWLPKIFFKKQLIALYLLGFQRGFEHGGKAMEATFLLSDKNKVK